MATQALTFLFADTEGSVTMAQRLGDACERARAGRRRLFRAGRAAHGG